MDTETSGPASDRPERRFAALEGRVLADRFRIANVISVGANTVIADAFDDETSLPVTVKIVQPELAADAEFRDEFERVATVSAAITHPNVATVVHWGSVDLDGTPTVYWVVEYLSGGSLRDLGDRGRLLEPSQALVVGLEACRALDAAHQRGVIHSEITPSKLVFGDDRRLRIVDFGMARLLGARAWRDPAHVSTHVARYASPEQALGMPIDSTTDIYALSLCLVESVTGAVPFAADSTTATLTARVGKLLPVSADLGSLAAVLERAARPEADDRYSATEFGRALVDAASKLPRPEPIPIVAADLFDTSEMRRPSDPTGGIARPETESPPEPEPVADESHVATAAAAAGVAVAAAARTPTVEPRANERAETDTDGDPFVEEPLIVMDDPPPGRTDTEQMPLEATPAGAATTTIPAVAPFPYGAEVADEDDSGSVLYDEEQRRPRWPKVLLILLLVLIGIAAVSYAGYLLLRTKSFEVPDLVGVPEAVARNEVAGNGWDIVTAHERSDVQRGIGDVIATTPVAGVMLDEGESITFVISDGPLLRTLPELDGLPLTEAQAELEALELDWIVAPAEFHEEIPPNHVVSWQVQNNASLRAGGEVLPGTVVVLTPSMGPEPRSVPSLVNLTFEEAETELASRRLLIARTADVFSDEFEPGRIVSQAPAPESVVERESTVTVTVSKGPDVVAFPDVVGMPYAEGEPLLIESGFTIGQVLGTTEGTIQSVSIAGNPVSPGEIFRRGTAVDMISL
ncbi:MAG: PASTA domain-containing protein [Acidimicrobiia bacterium]|nr:PASTA domain-containing protein [Acidimicrobiia bacterium]